MPERRRSNAEVAAASVRRLRSHLEAGGQPPLRNGVVNVTALAREAGLDRQFLYANEEGARLLAEHAAANGWRLPGRDLDVACVPVPSDTGLAKAERRIKHLEEMLAVAKVELRDLRQRLARLSDLESILSETGMLPR